MKPTTDLRAFWEQRLEGDWTERGVGYHALGRPFNTWMYRVRREVFRREAVALDVDLPTARVFDVGSGTGFYVRGWQEVGVGSVTGSDLTRAAVDNLRRAFPGVPFQQLDISEQSDVSEQSADLEPGSFDVVSAMDVLFHITDDDRYRAAIANIGRLVRPGGSFVLSENFLHRPEQRGPHQVNRTLEDITAILDAAGFDVLRRVPMLVLMNAQVDTGRVRRKLWGGFLRAITLTPPTGWLAGAVLYQVEHRLVRRLRESPTTELMVCRRRPR